MTNQMAWVVSVPVATIWTSPNSPRAIDEAGLTNPLNVQKWYEQLNHDLRLELCDQNLVQSQLLFGEEVIVDEIIGDWAKIIAIYQPSKKDPRGYPGWVPLAQIKQVKVTSWRQENLIIVTRNKTKLTLNNESLELSFATILPLIDIKGEVVTVQTPLGKGLLSKVEVEKFTNIKERSGDDLVEHGKTFLGLPYFWGGMSAYGYDCSGFVYNMHKVNGIIIPRDASDQVLNGEEVNLNELNVGDLLFFAYKEGQGNIHHVGFYYGEGKMLHSPSTGKGIEIIPIKGTIYERELCKAVRY